MAVALGVAAIWRPLIAVQIEPTTVCLISPVAVCRVGAVRRFAAHSRLHLPLAIAVIFERDDATLMRGRDR
jgi:hypothetical protein